jgi:beta-lactamase class A
MIKLLSLMNQGQVVDPDSDQQMLDIMAQCKTNTWIPALLPDGVRVEHKTGSIDHLANDVGIVRTHKGDYILALFYNGNIGSREEYISTSFKEAGDKILSELSRDIYNAFITNK